MRTSDQINELVADLAKAQAAYKPVKKTSTVKTDKYSYHYAELPDIFAATLPALNANNLALTQAPDWHEGQFVLLSRLAHASGQWIECVYPLALPAQARPQEIGSQLTYARRYSASALLGIATEDDDDAQAGQAAHVTTRKPTATPKAAEDKPATTGEIHTVKEVTIAKGGKKTGGEPEKPWTRYWVQAKDGEYYSTFDTKLGEELVKAKRDAYPVDLDYMTTTKGDTVTQTIVAVRASLPEGEDYATPNDAASDDTIPF